MSSFAVVAPLEVHKRLEEAGQLGDYHLLLAHEVLDDPVAYMDFWQPRKKQFIIMDNSLIELGKPLPVDQVCEAAELVNATCVVLPDILGMRLGTLERSYKAYDDLLNLKAPYEALGVAQGTTQNDVFSCGRDMIEMGVQYLSVPRHVQVKIGSRVWVTKQLAKYGKPIHLLGFSDNNYDDMFTANLPGVMGIDSALPIWYGNHKGLLPFEPRVNGNYGKRPWDYNVTKVVTLEAIENVRRVRGWVSYVARDVERVEQAAGQSL